MKIRDVGAKFENGIVKRRSRDITGPSECYQAERTSESDSHMLLLALALRIPSQYETPLPVRCGKRQPSCEEEQCTCTYR